MSNIISLKYPPIASNIFIHTYECEFSTFPEEFSQYYEEKILNQGSTSLCGLLTIYELIKLQNKDNMEDIKDIMKWCSNIYKYNKEQGRDDDIYDYIISIHKYARINFLKISQCKDINSIKDAIIHNKGIILNIPYSKVLDNYDKNYLVSIKDNTKYNNSNHSILCIGYVYIKEQLYLECVNTYGTSYGNNGRVFIPIDYPMIEYPYTFKSKV